MSQMMNKFAFGKILSDTFTYTGILISQDSEKRITIDQNSFCQTLSSFHYTQKNLDDVLCEAENNFFRKSTGQLN